MAFQLFRYKHLSSTIFRPFWYKLVWTVIYYKYLSWGSWFKREVKRCTVKAICEGEQTIQYEWKEEYRNLFTFRLLDLCCRLNRLIVGTCGYLPFSFKIPQACFWTFDPAFTVQIKLNSTHRCSSVADQWFTLKDKKMCTGPSRCSKYKNSTKSTYSC